jgi:CubicO group peptidase (beta-lactamase class C family)
MKHSLFFLFICIILTGCLKDDYLKTRNITFLPEELNDGWEIDTVTAHHFDMEIFDVLLQKIYSYDEFLLVRGVVVIKNGKLVAEIYPRAQEDRTTLIQQWSVTKSFISILTGIAIESGNIRSVSEPVFHYMPEYRRYAYPELIPLTIEECLTMRSGINYDNSGCEEEEILAGVPNDLTRYILGRPMKYLPGKIADYKNSDPQLLVKVISNATKKDLITFAKEGIFNPLGIEDFSWSRNKDNTPYGGFGLFLTPRAMAKIGQVLLNKGVWQAQRIISEEWIVKVTTPKTIINGYEYGYYFWIDTERGFFWAWGARGQFIFVVPEKDLVVVIASDPYGEKETNILEALWIVDMLVEGVVEN